MPTFFSHVILFFKKNVKKKILSRENEYLIKEFALYKENRILLVELKK